MARLQLNCNIMTYTILDIVFIVLFGLLILTFISISLLVLTPNGNPNSKEEKYKTVERDKIRRREIGDKAATNFKRSNNNIDQGI